MSIYIGGPVLVDDYSAMQGPAPSGFHVPLSTEWQGLQSIMYGLGLTTGDNWRINLHMPFVGSRNYRSAALESQGYNGNYWSSSTYRSGTKYSAYDFYLNSDYVQVNNNGYCAYGLSIRCFKDSYVEPTSSWTIITGTLGSAGIFWNQTEGLISITNGTTGYTIQDKNLGATSVYNDGDTLTQANMGKMYQRGNNYGFSSTGSVTTSGTQVDASNYGPGNYYSSVTFITRSSSPYNRDYSNNDNLRGGVTGVVQKTEYQEVKNIYIGETINIAGIYHNADLGLISISSDGEDWTTFEDKNLGASTAGTSSSSYGDYYCWGSTSNCNGQVTSSYTVQEDWSAGTQSIAKSGFHIPTTTEFTNLVSLYQSLTGKTTSADLQSDLMFPLAGQKIAANTTISYAGTGGYMWAKEKTGSNGYFFRIAQLNTGNNSAKTGFSVRLFKDSGQIPTSDWTALAQLYNYNQLCALPENDGLTELNTKPQVYYNKYNTEGYITFNGESLYYELNGTRFITADGSIRVIRQYA